MLISYYESVAEDALDSSDYAETDDEIERCMSDYFEAKNMIELISYLNKSDNQEARSF